MPQILIVADDLTGSLDSAVRFVRAGRRVMVARNLADMALCISQGADVISVNTASRQGSALAAVRTVEALVDFIDLQSVPLIMKKVDSRLKGHPGAEGRALARLAGHDEIVAAPALPRMGRLQSGGELTGTGIETAIDIRQRLGDGMVVPDVASENDLDVLVANAVTRGSTLWLGASDLASALARAEFGEETVAPPTIAGPLAMMIGSRDPITVAQVDELLRCGVQVHRAPNGVIGLIECSSKTCVVAISAGREASTEVEAGARFAAGAARILQEMEPKTLLCSGGETAHAILSLLGVDCMELLGEIAPGLPCCRISSPWGEVYLITKSGGFGHSQMLAELAMSVLMTEKRV